MSAPSVTGVGGIGNIQEGLRRDAPPPTPNRLDLQKDIWAKAPGLKLYKHGSDWFYFECGGNHYLIPPDLPGNPEIPHPVKKAKNGAPIMVPADGTLVVRDRFGPLLNPITKRSAGWGAVAGESAMDIVSYALDVWGDEGVVWLDGTNDPGRKEASKKLVHRASRRWAEQQGEARSAFVENWNRQVQNKGKTPPPPTANQIKAQELLDELKSEGRSGAEYICEYGCYETSDLDKFKRHMLAQHNKVVRDPSLQVVAPDIAPSTIAARAAEYSKNEAVAGAAPMVVTEPSAGALEDAAQVIAQEKVAAKPIPPRKQ